MGFWDPEQIQWLNLLFLDPSAIFHKQIFPLATMACEPLNRRRHVPPISPSCWNASKNNSSHFNPKFSLICPQKHFFNSSLTCPCDFWRRQISRNVVYWAPPPPPTPQMRIHAVLVHRTANEFISFQSIPLCHISHFSMHICLVKYPVISAWHYISVNEAREDSFGSTCYESWANARC